MQRAIGAFTAPPRLRGVAQNVFDAQARQGAADLGEPCAIGRRAGGGRVDRPVRAIGVQCARQAVRRHHLAQRGHNRLHALAALDELSIEQAIGGIVHDGQQRVPGVREQGEPPMAAPVEVQQLAQARPRLPPAAMPASCPPLGHKPRGLEGLLDEAVRQLHLMIAPHDVAEMPHVKPGVAVARPVALAVEPQHALQLRHRHRPGRTTPAVIEQAVVAHLLIAQPEPAHRARTQAQDVGHL